MSQKLRDVQYHRDWWLRVERRGEGKVSQGEDVVLTVSLIPGLERLYVPTFTPLSNKQVTQSNWEVRKSQSDE